MTGQELRQLRDNLARGSTARLARMLGCSPETIRTNMMCHRVTLLVAHLVDTTPVAAAHLRGMRRGRMEAGNA
jgi:hypothetical protein